MIFEESYKQGFEKVKFYENEVDNSDLSFSPKTNILFIETNLYAGNFSQDICEAVFGYEYAEDIRSSSMSPDFISSMKNIGYNPEHFWSISEGCYHEEYGEVIASIIPTPNVVNEKHPGFPIFHTVGLFFNQEIEKKDLEVIFNISSNIVKKSGGDILAIGQFLKK